MRDRLFKFTRMFLVAMALCTSGRIVTAADKMTPLSPDRVRASGEIGRRIDITINNNFMVVDLDEDFLRPFQDRTSKPSYIGLGKTIDAAVRLAFYSGDAAVLTRKKHLVDETIKTQGADGYIGLMTPEKRMWVLWDIHEMVYLVYGLTSDYTIFAEKKSLQAAQKLADYIIGHWPEGPPDWPGDIHRVMAMTGIDRAFLALTAATGDSRYQDFLITSLGLANWDMEIVQGRHDKIEGHAYAFMARTLAQTELYRLTLDEKLLSQAHRVIRYLTEQDGLLINGACSYQECWHDTQIGFFKLGETCATAYLVRLLDSLLRLEGNALYGDIMERTILNALFAAQSPDGRRLRYYVPFEGERLYFDKDTYCCPCNYRRIVAELPAMIYYLSDGGVAVNLYTNSHANIDLPDGTALGLKQTTDYPNSGLVAFKLQLSQPARFPMKFRIPRWCSAGAQISVNNQVQLEGIQAGGFLVLNRAWRNGDEIALSMPMDWRMVRGRKAQSGRVALMRGPMIYALNPSVNSAVKPEDLPLLRLDTGSLSAPFPDATVRPEGMGCRIKVWNPDRYIGEADAELLLTEYADPDGRATYFLLPDPKDSRITEDELNLQHP